MTNSYIGRRTGLSLVCALLCGLFPTLAPAQDQVPRGYLIDQRGVAVRSGSGLCWHTGTGPSDAMAECEPAAPVAAVAAPAPPPAPAPAALAPVPVAMPVAERVTLSADTLFDFDKAELRPAGREALDDFVVKLGGMEPEMIMATGHADRFGSDRYNQRLSEQRVESVRIYLVNKGVGANRIHTEGKGESEPISKLDDCAGAKSAQVIACLQPDRRVELEVVGLKKPN